jgi:hypothetical protein
MTITYPLDKSFLANLPGFTTDFDLLWRQEQSRTAGGRTVVKDFGSPLWRASVQSRSLKPNELDHWRARLTTLENGLKTFRSFPKVRWFPIAYPNGSWPTGDAFAGVGSIATIAANRKAVSVSGFPAGYRFSIGDYLQIGEKDLHQVVEAAVVDENGVSPQFEIRPHLWPGVAAPVAVTVKQPACLMTVVPGSVSSSADLGTGRGAISFQAIEAR